MSAADIPCPTCGVLLAWSVDNPFRPFCSERCRLVDLGGWFEERYRIPGEPVADHETPPDSTTPGRLQ